VFSALAMMEKMPPGFNPTGGDWRFTLILPDGRLFGSTNAEDEYTVEFCQKCHIDAGADRLFGKLRGRLLEGIVGFASSDPKEIAREAIRQYLRFAAEHPDLFRFMVDESKHADERMQWLVDTHLRPLYDGFQRFGESLRPVLDPASLPHAYYVLAGASSLIFAAAPECRRLTGLDPETTDAFETHAEVMARLLVP
jgi:hypothetical protein